MMKRTLWYACLVLLCCGIGAMVVLATSSGKTTLVPASGTSVSTAPATGAGFAATKATTNMRATKDETASRQVQADVPSPATTLTETPEVFSTTEEESKAVDVDSKSLPVDAKSVEATEELRTEDTRAADMNRKALVVRAEALGFSSGEVAGMSDSELYALIANASTSSTLERPEEESIAVPVFEAAGQSMPTEEKSAFYPTPDLMPVEENLPLISADDELELAAKAVFERWNNGMPVTREDKAIVSAYEDLHRPTPDAPRGDRSLDDNGGTFYVYSGDTLKVPPSGAGGTGSDTTRMNITVSGADAYILDVEIQIDSLRHTFDGDLDIFLRGPSGVVCTLSTDNGSTGDNMIRTLFDDEATGGSITGATAPMTGSYVPEYPLSIFDGLDPNGQWTLLIADDAGGDSGVIYSARLQIATANTTLLHNFTTTAITSPGGGTQAPGSTVPVTAIFANLGTTTESATAKYQFNGGTVESEATDALAQFGRDTITFTNSITMPVTAGDYELVVWVEVAGEGDTSNDTLRRTIHVMWDGFACATAIEFATDGPDSLTFNNTGAGDNSPGLTCYATTYNDMVFFMEVEDGYQGEIWQTTGTPDFKQSLRWGGDCPGTTVVDCRDTPDEMKMRFVNHTGSTQTMYYTCGNYSSGSGSFKLAWHRQATTTYNLPYNNGFEITVAPPMVPNYYMLPNYWSVENVNGDLYQWENYNSGAQSGTYCARAYCGSTAGANDWLFSPGLDLAAGNYYLEYWRKSYSATYPESLEVKIGTQNNSASMTGTVVLLDTFKTNIWVQKFAGFTVTTPGVYYIGFHSQARRSGTGMYLDNVTVGSSYNHDFKIASLTSPASTVNPNASVPVTAIFQNVGATAESAPVKYVFNSGTEVSENTATLAQFGTETHTFVTNFTAPATPGLYELVVWCDLIDDQDRSNDTIRRMVDVNFDAFDCATVRSFTTTGPDSLTMNNTGAGNNTPGLPCYTTVYADQVFSMDVANGEQGEIWQTSGTPDFYQGLRWGGACPGTTVIDCRTTPDEIKTRFVNYTGSTQTIYYTCGGSGSTAYGAYKLAWHRQPALTYAMPFLANFEITVAPPMVPTYHVLPDFWSVENGNGDIYQWENYNSGALTGTNCARMYNANTAGANDWLFTPGLQLTGGTQYYLEYWRKAYSTTVPESLEVAIGSQNNSASMTTTIVAMDTFKTNIWVQRGASFTMPTTGTYFIGFHSLVHRSSGGSYLDSISVIVDTSCAAPTVEATGAAGFGAVTLTANASGGAGSPIAYQWFTGIDCQNGNQIAGANAATYNATVAGSYSVRAWRSDSVNCAACDSAYADVIACATGITPFFSEGFESVTVPNLPNCWTMESFNAPSDDWITSASYPRTGTKSAFISWDGTLPLDDWLYTVGLNLSADTVYYLNFWYRAASSSWDETMEVKYGTAANSASMTNTLVPSWTFFNATYAEVNVSFQPAATGQYFIGFHAISVANQLGIAIDDIVVYAEGYCQDPTVTANAATGNIYATLTSTVTGGFPAATTYQWYTGTDCQAGNEISGATGASYYTVNSGVYSVKAMKGTSCSACDSAEATVTPDACTPISTFPSSENFDGVTTPNLPTCWTKQDVNGVSSVWNSTTSNPFSAPNCVYITYNTTVGNDDWLFTPKYTLTGGQTYVLSYMRRSYSASYADSMEIKYGAYPVSTYMTNVLAPIDSVKRSVYAEKSVTFTPAVTGDYYIGFHSLNKTSLYYTYIDDFLLYPEGICIAPTTMTVADCTGIESVRMYATAAGGIGGPIQYQWYTGGVCDPDSAITGATNPWYWTYVSGTFSCKAWRFSEDTCAVCDSGVAVVNPAPPGYGCSTAIEIFPVLGVADSSLYDNTGMGNNNPGLSCITTAYNDMVFKALVGPNQKLTMWQSSNAFDSYHSMRPICDDTTGMVGCSGTDELPMTYVNCDVASQYVYFIVGGASSAAYGNFMLAWKLEDNTCTEITCTPTVTETEPNDGCNASGFNTLTWGTSVVSGNLTATRTTRDVDAYEIVLTDCTNITIDITAEFDVAVQMRWDTTGGVCPDTYKDSVNVYGVCAGESKTFYNIPAGLAHIVVYLPFNPTCTTRDYCMEVTCAAGTLPPGDDCSDPIALPMPAANDTVRVAGTTVGFVANYIDSCDFTSSGPDVIYSFTLTECRRMAFRLTGGDMHIALWESGQCGTINAFLCNDDQTYFDTLAWENYALRGTGTISFCGGEIPAGTYYIRVGRYSTSSGEYQLTVFDYGACPCEIVCDGGDAVEVTENRYDRTFNVTDPDGGCNSEPVVFGAANCGTTICGVAWNYQRVGTSNQGNRDTDWYLFTLTDRKIVSVTLDAEFPAWVGVLDTNGCVSEAVLFGDSTVPACTPTTVSDTLDAGTYSMVVLPRYFVGNPLPSQYRATLVCNCLVGPAPVDVTVKTDSLDATPTGSNYKNDARLRWTADSSMAGTGTYKVYWNAAFNTFDPLNPTSNGWTVLATGIVPVLGPHATTYDDLNVVNATNVKRYYIVVSTCE